MHIGATGFEPVVALYLLRYPASVGSTEAANEVVARFGVVGPKRARGMEANSLGRRTPAVNDPTGWPSARRRSYSWATRPHAAYGRVGNT